MQRIFPLPGLWVHLLHSRTPYSRSLVVLLLLLSRPLWAQYDHYLDKVWERKAQPVGITTFAGDTYEGLLLFASKEGIALLPNYQTLLPVEGEAWEPTFVPRTDIAQVRPYWQPQPFAKFLSTDMLVATTGAAIGGVASWASYREYWGLLAGGVYGGVLGIVPAIVVGADHSYRKRLGHELYFSHENALRPHRAWKTMVRHYRPHTLVAPAEFIAFDSLRHTITTHPQPWEALVDVSKRFAQLYPYTPNSWLQLRMSVGYAPGLGQAYSNSLPAELALETSVAARPEIEFRWLLNDHHALGILYSGFRHTATASSFAFAEESEYYYQYISYYDIWESELTANSVYLPYTYIWRPSARHPRWTLQGQVAPGIEWVEVHTEAQWLTAGNYFESYSSTQLLRNIVQVQPGVRFDVSTHYQQGPWGLTLGVAGTLTQPMAVPLHTWDRIDQSYPNLSSAFTPRVPQPIAAMQLPLTRIGAYVGVGWAFGRK